MSVEIQQTRYGEQGVLLSPLTDRVLFSIHAHLESEPLADFVESVVGYDSLLLIFSHRPDLRRISAWLNRVSFQSAAMHEEVRVHEILVDYNGPDLEIVAERTGLSESEVVQRHSAPTYTVRFMGFSPGFPYLDGLPTELHLPRKDTPRLRIKAGSVSIGGSHAGIYPVESPGGWHILGNTKVELFRPARAVSARPRSSEIFLFEPGDQIRFRPV